MKRPPPVLNQLNIVSGDMSLSLDFYRRLGLELPPERVWATKTGNHHASAISASTDGGIDLDIDSIEFAQMWNSGWSGRGDLRGRTVVGFQVHSRDMVDEIYADLTGAGHKGLQPPYDAFWGARYAVVEDPDGIAVGLMSPVSLEFKSRPPDI